MQRMFGSITQKRPLETSDIRGWAKVAKLARLMALPWDCELRVAWLESRRFFDNKQVHWLPKFQAGGRVEFASPPCQKLGFSLDLSGDGRPVRCPKLGASNYILKSYLKSAENSSKASETRINTGWFLLWRRGRDSNPRDPFEPNGFQDRRFQPLTHLSVSNYNVIQTLVKQLVTSLSSGGRN